MITIENKKTDRLMDFKFREKYSQINPYDYIHIFQSPDWYIRLNDMFSEFFYTYTGKEKKPKEWLKKREEIVKMVDELLKANLISLGVSGKNHDEERKPIDLAIIHHTSTSPTKSMSYLNALTLIRLYAKSYGNYENKEYGKPIWSNHLKDGHQIFIPYHYLIKRDGTFERVLNDDQIGWHSGDWSVNCRSIAICFLDDLENSKPTELAMQTAIQILKKYNLGRDSILGHREINPMTTCPGKNFFEWKYALLPQSSL